MIHAGEFRGELDPSIERVRLSAECEDRATENNLEPDPKVLASLSEQWRYERDLITAEETERWLEERWLTLDDFNDYFVRRYWTDSLGGQAALARPDPLPLDHLQEILRVELQLSGEFDRLAVQLSWRAAALNASPDASDAMRLNAQGKRFDPAMEKLARMGVDEEWFAEMLKLEARFERECDAVLTEEARARSLAALRIPLTRLELEVVDVESRDAAREAALCIRADGATIAQVASDGGYPHRRFEILVEDLTASLQQTFLCAAPGELLGPFERGDGFQLSQLVSKTEPELGDSEVRRRVERQILERHFSDLTGKHVQWMIAPNSPAA